MPASDLPAAKTLTSQASLPVSRGSTTRRGRPLTSPWVRRIASRSARRGGIRGSVSTSRPGNTRPRTTLSRACWSSPPTVSTRPPSSTGTPATSWGARRTVLPSASGLARRSARRPRRPAPRTGPRRTRRGRRSPSSRRPRPSLRSAPRRTGRRTARRGSRSRRPGGRPTRSPVVSRSSSMARCRPASRPETSVSGWVVAYAADAIRPRRTRVVTADRAVVVARGHAQDEGGGSGDGEESTGAAHDR